VLTEASGQVEIDVPRDRAGTFEPKIVRKRQRRLNGVDEVVLSLYAKGLTTGEISAHFAEIYGASVSKETISRITDKPDFRRSRTHEGLERAADLRGRRQERSGSCYYRECAGRCSRSVARHGEVEEAGRLGQLERGQDGFLPGGGGRALSDLSVGCGQGDQVHPVHFVRMLRQVSPVAFSTTRSSSSASQHRGAGRRRAPSSGDAPRQCWSSTGGCRRSCRSTAGQPAPTAAPATTASGPGTCTPGPHPARPRRPTPGRSRCG